MGFLLVSSLALASGVEFRVSASELGGGADDGDSTSARLKQRAVQNFLRRALGNRYASVERKITPEFAERYVLDYKTQRGPRGMEILGHLDGDALKSWARGAAPGADVSSGGVCVLFDKIDSYKSFKAIDSGFTKLEFVDEAILRRVEGGLAEFEIKTGLSATDFLARLQDSPLGSYSFKSCTR